MFSNALNRPRRIMMTLDAVGGIWRYALDLADTLACDDVDCLLVGSGPAPSEDQRRECEALHNVTLDWMDLPLDWMVDEPSALNPVGPVLLSLAEAWGADLLHLNLPSQAAGMPPGLPVVVMAHSCLPTWWLAVKGGQLPTAWHWQRELVARGLKRSSVVMVPTAGHGEALTRAYGPISRMRVAPNAAMIAPVTSPKKPFVLAAGRWWDEGKGADIIDAAAAHCRWPILLAGALNGPNGCRATVSRATPLGHLSSKAVREKMGRAAIFVAPALYEPFGLAVLEAAASGGALVLSDIPTFRELWEGAAILVPPRDAPGFAAALNHLADNSLELSSLSSSAAARARQFTPGRQKERVLTVYAEALMASADAG
jgi:glycosyltransferase involved in cell wall biosynthesis